MDRNKKGQYIKRHDVYNLVDMVGKRFGRLTVIKRSFPNTKNGCAKWLCRCDCEKEKIVEGRSLRRGSTKSCGCLHKEGLYKLRKSELDSKSLNMRQALIAYKRHAKKRNVAFGLSEKQFVEITQKDCFYCGAKPNNISDRAYLLESYIYNGIDRVDNTNGYTIDNVVPCCKKCNYAKNDMTLQEFKNWVKRIYNKFIGGRE
jgi:hypothetical protein